MYKLNFNITDYLKLGANPWFLSNLTIYLIIFAWITKATKIFYILISPLIVNAIIGTILICIYWNKLIIKYKIDYARENKITIEDIDNIIEENKTVETVFRILLILIHWLPIGLFYYLGYFETSMISGISGMAIWILGFIYVSVYFLIVSINKKANSLYGGSNKQFIIAYPIILLIICNYIFKS